ncbi:NAD-dependent malic enzyme 59 kDa isoform, mitochondrial-like [Actinidia eriantha]|uniref:NAD-dependent malic enzyme 59 kDa isoform, mitochondrial-like n=1 Tax=Actinidia eriantha TaxID=165200 RepID=UPI00258EE320|nr:NAD-dependent malic enzyme 59 kDa isoform, mitochondrial-like [Actinidia eriantha]XP_057508902.1 NAD-dependent malic enzyme 59 kDa isoform, mitochondrial-like [Actinidia eriantha]
MWRLARSAASNLRRTRRFSTAIPGPCMVHKRGADILHDPWFNKDTGFPLTERDRLGLRGLLPPRVISFEQQYARFMESYRSLEKNTQGQPDSVVSLAKWRILNRLHDRNETLYYRALIDNIEDFAPIIYTPTVGLVCQNYSGLFRRPRGMYFSARDKGEMMSMIYNWPAHQVDMIVLTDGSRILGLGDLGVQGIGIPIGKLDMYVAAAGINPQRILPVMLDVGTNNQRLLEDRLYLGLRQPRLEGEEYLSIVDEFMEAVHARWPKAVVQFEDFQMKWAFETLQRYRKKFCMFNDDIQGTAGVALAGVLGTVRTQGRPLTDFVNQKIVVVGAGSAGLGVFKMAVQAASRMAGAGAKPQFFLLDKDGLITKARKNIDPEAAPFAKSPGEIEGLGLVEGANLIEVINKVKPHVLLGLSGVGGVFNEEVLKAMRESDSPKPAIFSMSNPTLNAECTAVDAFKHAGENIVFASGSPFKNVDLGNGKVGHVNQANNMYLFPGIGLGALLSGARLISDGMLQAAAECLASYITDEEIQSGMLYPSIRSIRDITAEVGVAVVQAAIAEELAEGHGNMGPKELVQMSKEEIVEYVKENMWYPVYSPLVHEK